VKSKYNKEEERYKLKRLKEAVDAEHLLQLLGFDIARGNPREVRAPCKVHGGDNKTSFRMKRDTKNWICFSHACHEDVGNDVISLVMKMLNLNFIEAVKYLESITGINIHDEASYVEFKRSKERKDFISQTKDNRQVPPALVSEKYLESFKKFRSKYFEGEGYPFHILDQFEIGGGYVDKYGFQRDVIPIRDAEGVLKSYSCRDITGKADEDYKYLLTKGFDKDKVLYNLHRAKHYMDESRTLIVVEGFKSVWKLYMAGYLNVVACMGNLITHGQQNLLYSNAFTIITLFDGDEGGIKGTLMALRDMKDKIVVKPVFLPYTGKDPSDYTIEELQLLLNGGKNG
jgi:DNA primase